MELPVGSFAAFHAAKNYKDCAPMRLDCGIDSVVLVIFLVLIFIHRSFSLFVLIRVSSCSFFRFSSAVARVVAVFLVYITW